MSVQVDLSVLELVCSRLCHDLVGPVGAAANGIELLRETMGSGSDDVLDMTDESARTAWRRLEFFRVAFGYGGGRNGWSEAELTALANGMLQDTRTELDWPPSGLGTDIAGRGGKLILNLAFLMAEAMPRGGRLKVSLRESGENLIASFKGLGNGAALNPRVASTVTGKVPPGVLDSRVILAHLTYLQCYSAGATIHLDSGDDRVEAEVTMPLTVGMEEDLEPA